MPPPNRDPVLILVGHGSKTDADAAYPTVAAAARVARRGRFRAIAAQVKGEPGLGTVLEGIPADQPALVLPHFAGDGVFATRFIPEIVARHGGHLKDVRVLPALGGSPAVVEHVHALLGHVADASRTLPDLLVLAHGSDTSAAGDRAAEEVAYALGGSAVCRSAHTLFLEHAPRLGDWRRLPLGRDVVVCIMLAARGRHARNDVPEAFGLPPGSPLIGSSGEAIGPIVAAGRRLWLHAVLSDARVMADAAEDAAGRALAAREETRLAARALDHNQGALAAAG